MSPKYGIEAARATAILTWCQIQIMFRQWGMVFWSLLFPSVMIVVFGEIFGNDPRPELKGAGFVDMLVPGLMAVAVSSTAFYQVGVGLVDLRERQVLRRLRVTPLPVWSILVSQILPGYLMILLTSWLVWTIGAWIYDVKMQGNILMIFGVLTFGSVGFLSLAFAMAGLVQSSGTANALASGLNMLMMIFSGAIVPLEAMPDRFQSIGKLLPLTYVLDLLRLAFSGQSFANSPNSVYVVIGCLVSGVVISSLTFKWE